MQRILIVIASDILLLFMAAFIIFAAVRYLTEKEDRPEKILFFVMAFLAIVIAIIASIGILTC